MGLCRVELTGQEAHVSHLEVVDRGCQHLGAYHNIEESLGRRSRTGSRKGAVNGFTEEGNADQGPGRAEEGHNGLIMLVGVSFRL